MLALAVDAKTAYCDISRGAPYEALYKALGFEANRALRNGMYISYVFCVCKWLTSRDGGKGRRANEGVRCRSVSSLISHRCVVACVARWELHGKAPRLQGR
jgi:hypothetical protein